MPQFRRYNNYPSSYNRRPMNSHLSKSYGKVSKYMTAQNAARALDLALKTKKLLNVEYKHHNVGQLSTAITDAGIFTTLSNLTEGSTSTARDGGQVKWTSFRLSYSIALHASARLSLVRILVVQDKQTNQALFTLADLLFDATVQDAIFSPYNINNASRFNVLYDRVHSLADNGANQIVTRTVIKKLNIKMRYDANAGSINDNSQDSLALIFISDQTTNDPTISFQYRGRFIDN